MQAKYGYRVTNINGLKTMVKFNFYELNLVKFPKISYQR
jgi:hypothetical protein